MEDSTAGVLFPETWYMLTTMAGRSRPVAMEARFRRSLSSFVQKMAATPGIRELLRHAFEVVRGVVPVDAMFIAALTGERRYLKMLEGLNNQRARDVYLKMLETDLDDQGNRVFCAPEPIDPNYSTILDTLNQHRYVLVNRSKAELRRLARGYFEGDRWTPVGNPKRRSASLLFVPIWHGATYAGAMSVQSYEPNSYDEADAERLVVVADYIGLAIRHTRLVEGDGRPRRA